MTILIKQLVAALSALWVPCIGFFEDAKQQVTRLQRFVRLLTGRVLGRGGDTVVKEVVVDGSNVLRNTFAHGFCGALLGACRDGGQLPTTPADINTFVDAMATHVAGACRSVCEVAVAAGAEFVVFALDERKQRMALLDKGRHVDPYAEPTIEGDAKARLRGFLGFAMAQKSGHGQWATRTVGESKRAVIAVLADLLHRSADGQALLRLVMLRAIALLKKQFALTITLVEAREADIVALNRSTALRGNVPVQRAVDEVLVVVQNDADVGSQPRSRETPMLNVDVSRGQLRARTDTGAQARVLRFFVQTFAEGLEPADTVFVPGAALWWKQRFIVFVSTFFGLSDYKLHTRRGGSAYLLQVRNGKRTPVPVDALNQLLRAFAGVLQSQALTKRDALVDVSLPHLLWVARHAKVAYFEAKPKRRQQLQRIVDALQDPDNLLQFVYGGYSRLLIVFPTMSEREEPLKAFEAMWPAGRMPALHDIVPTAWRDEVHAIEFALKAVTQEPSLQAVNGFLAAFFPADLREKAAVLKAERQQRAAQPVLPPAPAWRAVGASIKCTDSTPEAAQQSANAKKAKVNPRHDVERGPWRADPESLVGASAHFDTFAERLVADAALCALVVRLKRDLVARSDVTLQHVTEAAQTLQLPLYMLCDGGDDAACGAACSCAGRRVLPTRVLVVGRRHVCQQRGAVDGAPATVHVRPWSGGRALCRCAAVDCFYR